MTMDIDLTYMNEVESGDLKNIIRLRLPRKVTDSDFEIRNEYINGISKYCISIITKSKLKSNRFKEKLLFINKLKQI